MRPAQGADVASVTGSTDAHRDGPNMRWWVALLCAVVGGAATYLAFPAVGWWPSVVVGPALLVVAVAGRSAWGAFGLGVCFGVAFFAPLLWWLVNLSVFALAALVIVQSLFLGLHGVLVRLLVRWRWWPVTVAASWVAVEALRGRVPLGGFPWGRLGLLTVAGLRLGDVICYEVAYDDLVRSTVDGGAQILVVQTNNATYMRDGQLGETLQQLAMARVRAVEFNRPAVVASTTGVSAIIRPDGSLAATTGAWEQDVLVDRVTLRNDRSWHAGPWLEWAAVGVVIAAVTLAGLRRRGAAPPAAGRYPAGS